MLDLELYSNVMIFTSLISSLIIIYSLRTKKNQTGFKTGLILYALIIIWCFGYAMEIRSPDFLTKLRWMYISYASTFLVPPIFLIYLAKTLDLDIMYHGKQHLIGIPHLLTSILLMTNETYGLIWSSISLNSDPITPQ